MPVEKVDPRKFNFGISRDLAVTPAAIKPGPPVRIDGLSVGIVTMNQSAPHGGEMHPDGDEILYVISGRLAVTWDSAPEAELILEAGDACIVSRGEWHRVMVLEPTTLVHITPGPEGAHRPLN